MGLSPVVASAVRRNRVRLAFLAIVGSLNYLILLSLFGGLFAWIAAAELSTPVAPHWHPSRLVFVAGFLVTGLVLLGALTAAALRRVRRLPHALGVRDGAGDRRSMLVVEALSVASGLPACRVGVVDAEAPNALAVGLSRRRSQILVTSGLLARLSQDELEAVLAAELFAVARLDAAVRTFSAFSAYGTRAFYRSFFPATYESSPMVWPWVIALWPTQVLAKAMWRSVVGREARQGDEVAIATTRNPEALLSALVKLRDDRRTIGPMPAESVPLWLEPAAVQVAGEGLPFPLAEEVAMFDSRIAHLCEHIGVPVPRVREDPSPDS